MKLRWLWVALLLCGLCSAQAGSDNRVMVRTTLGLQGSNRFVTAFHRCRTAPWSLALMVHSTSFSCSLLLLT